MAIPSAPETLASRKPSKARISARCHLSVRWSEPGSSAPASGAGMPRARANSATTSRFDVYHRAGTRILQELAAALTARGVPTPAGKGDWRPE